MPDKDEIIKSKKLSIKSVMIQSVLVTVLAFFAFSNYYSGQMFSAIFYGLSSIVALIILISKIFLAKAEKNKFQ